MFCQRIGRRKNVKASQNARQAQILLAFCFAASFATVSGKAIHYAASAGEIAVLASASEPPLLAMSRPDIVDRNGRLLATDIKVYWLSANPKEIPHADDAAEKLAALFPDLNQAALAKSFHEKTSRFIWVKRGLTPNQANAAHELGIPGLTIFTTGQRVYPAGDEAAQIIGITDVDNKGISGIEWYIDRNLEDRLTPASLAKRPFVKLSLDLGVQHALTEELTHAMDRYHAAAALGLVLNVRNGEVLASASLPDFDPNRRGQSSADRSRNRVVTDDYELGSVFKTITVAMALDRGVASRYETFDASPMRIGHFVIRDPHAGRLPMTVEDIFVHSSNTGAARIALAAGVDRQRDFLKSIGLFERIETEAGKSPTPEFPKVWRPANSMTVAYGHGIAVPPLLFASAVATIVNGGTKIKPTFLLADKPADERGERVIQVETSVTMRELMRQVVERGTGRRAAVPGIDIGGKTGTAIKLLKDGHYTHSKVINSFIAAFPIADPKFLVLVTIDEPKSEGSGKPAEAAYNAAPTAGAIVKRIAPMLDVLPAPPMKEASTRRFDEAPATPYEQADLKGAQRAGFRKYPYETGGSDQGYSAYRQWQQPAPAPRYYGDNGR